MSAILNMVLPALLDWMVSGLTKLGRMGWVKYQSASKVRKKKKQINLELKRLQLALKDGYNGEPLNKSQKEEIDRAFSDLVRGY